MYYEMGALNEGVVTVNLDWIWIAVSFNYYMDLGINEINFA